MKEITNPRFMTIIGIILFASLSRLFPILPNFQPIMSIALFAGFFLENKKFAILIPILAMLLSDLLLEYMSVLFTGNYISGFHSTMPFVYASIILISLMGNLLKSNKSIVSVGLSSVASAVLFFFLTNLGFWMVSGMYPMNFSGLLLSFEMAIPFFRNTLSSSLIFSAVLFGGFYLAEKYVPKLTLVKIK